MRGVRALAIVALSAVVTPLLAQDGRGTSTPPLPPDTVPANLRPLLANRRSEVRLIALRYTADRQLLTTNYAGSGGGGRGRGGRAGGGPILGGQQADSAAAAATADSARNIQGGRGSAAGRGGRGGGADSTVAPPTTVSVARIARLKRFDMSWQSALNALDRAPVMSSVGAARTRSA